MAEPLSPAALDTLFRTARTYNSWAPAPFGEDDIRALYALARLGPTAANANPARFAWVVTEAGKARLAPLVSSGNRDKVQAASAVVIVGYDLDFPDTLARLFPHSPGIKDAFADPVARQTNAFRNSTLQGAYLIMAARALGWDTGPMSGFNNASVDAEFFAGTQIRSNFIMAIGRGTEERLFDRLPRLDFEEANQIL